MKLSGPQKLVRFFSPKKKFEKIRAESEQWGFHCVNCKEWSSVWSVGGIRYKAKGNPSQSIRCPKCEKISLQRITQKVDS